MEISAGACTVLRPDLHRGVDEDLKTNQARSRKRSAATIQPYALGRILFLTTFSAESQQNATDNNGTNAGPKGHID